MPGNCRRRLLVESWIPRCSLFHGLNQRLPALRTGPRVVTFHDLFVLSGEYSTAEFRARFAAQAREAAARADLIICVSAFTASQVEHFLKVDRGRLRVIWHGVHPPTGALPLEEQRENIVLHVGALQARKNIVRLLQAFEHMDSPWRLVLAGSRGYGADAIAERIAQSPARERIEVTGYVTDEHLQSLYRRAKVLAFPSLDEGFGIPLLEAMAHGLPIITSSGSALQEVAAGAAILVNPRNVPQMAEALRAVAQDVALRQQLIAAGLKVAERHSWRDAAAKTWDVYRELIGQELNANLLPSIS